MDSRWQRLNAKLGVSSRATAAQLGVFVQAPHAVYWHSLLAEAVQVALELLEKNPLPKLKKPDYPNYHQGTAASGGATP